MYSKAAAFILGIISFCPPFNGLLRFYLKHYVSGGIYTLTAGLCFIGNILDIVQVPQLVKQANMRLKQKELNLPESLNMESLSGNDTPALEYRKREESIQRQILLSAKRNSGYTTPSEVALESNVSIELVKEALDYLVSRGFAEMKINKAGTIVYFFPDMLDNVRDESFEDLT